VPGTYESAAIEAEQAAIEAEDDLEGDDDRDTLRAPPRHDQAPVMALPAPPPLPLARLALKRVFPPPLPSALGAVSSLEAAPPPLAYGVPATASAEPDVDENLHADDVPTLQPDAMEASDADTRSDRPGWPAESQLNSRDLYIPPLPVPKDMPKLLALERGNVDTQPPAPDPRLQALHASSLSPAERSAQRAESRGERPRLRLVGGLVLAASVCG
jgi:hypothetical protein